MKFFIGVDSSIIEAFSVRNPVTSKASQDATFSTFPGHVETVKEPLYRRLMQERKEENPVLFCDMKPM